MLHISYMFSVLFGFPCWALWFYFLDLLFWKSFFWYSSSVFSRTDVALVFGIVNLKRIFDASILLIIFGGMWFEVLEPVESKKLYEIKRQQITKHQKYIDYKYRQNNWLWCNISHRFTWSAGWKSSKRSQIPPKGFYLRKVDDNYYPTECLFQFIKIDIR